MWNPARQFETCDATDSGSGRQSRGCRFALALFSLAGVFALSIANISDQAVSEDQPPSANGKSEKPNTGKVTSRHKVLIIRGTEYVGGLTRLEGTRTSSKRLRKAFEPLGWDVKELSDRDATPEAIRNWLKDWANPNVADLALIFFLGHGEAHDGGIYYKTVHDPQGAGELLIEGKAPARPGKSAERALLDIASAGGWRTLFVCDFCRVGAVPVEQVLAQAAPVVAVPLRTNSNLDATRAPGPPENRPPVFYSTQLANVARDRNDFSTLLAEGLEIDPATKRFRADFQREPMEGHPLIVLDWFTYAAARMIQDAKLQQQPIARMPRVSDNPETKSFIRADTVIAEAAPPGLPRPLRLVRESGKVNDDLLPWWLPLHGHFQWERGLLGVWTISAPSDPVDQMWAGGFLGDTAGGVSTTDKALFVELFVEPDPTAAPDPERRIQIGLDAKEVHPPKVDRWISSDGLKRHFSVPMEEWTWCKIPLQSGRELNYLGISDIPPDYSVVIRRVFLSNATDRVPVQVNQTRDLLGRWWCSNEGRLADTLSYAFENRDGRWLNLKPGRGWLGGHLSPSVHLLKGDQVRVEIENLAAREARVTFEFKRGPMGLARQELTLKPGLSEHFIAIPLGEIADYLAILNPTTELRVRVIELQHAKVPRQ